LALTSIVTADTIVVYAKTGHKFGRNGVYNYSKSDTAVLNASNFNIGTQNVL